MPATTAVYLITGFLGSGKTTFLNRIIQGFPKDRNLMILMNEFGDTGVDGTLVDGDDLTMLEISKGSIFCVCVKTDFIKGLMDIAQRIQPDVLIIEATGVANPTDLKRDLKLSIFQDRFRLREQFCLIDAETFKDAYDAFTSVEKQIESATVFIINKVDLAEAGDLEKVRQIVAEHHPNPEFHETVHAQIPLDKYLAEFDFVDSTQVVKPKPVSPQALDAFVDALLSDSSGSTTPPDRLLSLSLTWTGDGLDRFKAAVELMPEGIVRAKGIVAANNDTYLFNYVMGRSQIEKISPKEKMAALINRIVFIGSPEAIEAVKRVRFEGGLQLSV